MPGACRLVVRARRIPTNRPYHSISALRGAGRARSSHARYRLPRHFGERRSIVGRTIAVRLQPQPRTRGVAGMADYMLIQFDAPWDAWKTVFDSDPAGRAEIAKGYTLFRGVDSPNDIYVQV